MTTSSQMDQFKSDAERNAEQQDQAARDEAAAAAAAEAGDDEQRDNQGAAGNADPAKASADAGKQVDGEDDADDEGDDTHELDLDASSRRSGRLDEIRRKSLEERGLAGDDADGDDAQRQERERYGNLPENVYEKDGQLYAKLKVDGEEIEKPLGDALSIAQKNAAADKRLQRSTAVLSELQRQQKELDAREQRLREAAERLQARITNTGKAPSGEDATDLEQTAEALVDAIYNDDPKTAAEHARKLAQGRGSATPKEAEELQAVVESLAAEQQEISRQKQLNSQQMAESERQVREEWSRGVERFKSTYPDIQQGSEAWRLASSLSRSIPLEEKFKDASFEEIFMEAGRRARETIKGVTPSLKDRTHRKLEASPHTASRSSVSQPVRTGQQPQKRKSGHDLVREMRRQRRPYADY